MSRNVRISPDETAEALSKRVLRLHILANSDSVQDQQVKLLVRDAVTAYQSAKMSAAENKAQAKAELMADGANLLTVVEGVLSENGCPYGATLYSGLYAFPDREYGEVSYPAGEYDALRIVLGEGKGQNWWCVMFPPLCILEKPDGKIEYEQFKFDSLLKKMFKRSEGQHESRNKENSDAAGDAAAHSDSAAAG